VKLPAAPPLTFAVFGQQAAKPEVIAIVEK
jgi:hypothetical protein